MTKTELVSAVAEKAGITKKSAECAVASVFDNIVKTVSKGGKVQIIGFGTFESRVRKARDGVNPLNGKPMHIPEAKVPAFKAGKAFKEKVAK